jgi:hypothetical protein
MIAVKGSSKCPEMSRRRVRRCKFATLLNLNGCAKLRIVFLHCKGKQKHHHAIQGLALFTWEWDDWTPQHGTILEITSSKVILIRLCVW